MTEDTIIFEHPLNERMRNLLRLEMLLMQTNHSLHGESIWDSRNTIGALMEILGFFARIDLKTELIRELERAATNLGRGRAPAGFEGEQLDSTLERLDSLRRSLHGMTAQLGHEMRADPLLAAVRQRSTVPGGTCGFDLPLLHKWLHQPAEVRIGDQAAWYDSLIEVREASELLLRLIRNSAELRKQVAEDGVFQQALDPGAPYQMVRVALPRQSPYFVEVSGGRHRISMRFVEPAEGRRPKQAEEPVQFQLASCVL